MTIIAGFRCVDGIVVCGDTQETSDIHKRNVTKVVVLPQGANAVDLISRSDVMATFCGAGNGDFIEMLIRKAWESTAHATDLEQACDFIELAIKDCYKEYGEIYQRGKCPSVSLIYGVKMNGDTRLFRAVGPIINPVIDYTSNGTGYHMADFLSSRMYNRTLTVHQCAILAAYILFQAKEHVDGCGGESHIAVLRHESRSGILSKHRVDGMTKILERVDKRLASILLASGNLGREYGTIVDMSLDNVADDIHTVRELVIKDVEKTEDLLWILDPINSSYLSNSLKDTIAKNPILAESDDLGFRPLDPQKSEDQP